MPSEVIRARPPRRVREPGASYGQDAEAPVEGPGWLWGDVDEGEEQFRTLVRDVERTMRAMAGDGALNPENLRRIRLELCRSAVAACEATGRPVPSYVHAVYNEVIGGRFR